jgi:sensor histidine kinase YesM
MESTLKKPHALPVSSPLTSRAVSSSFWEKWGAWLAILGCVVILSLYTDFGEFLQGFSDGFTDEGKRKPLSTGVLIGASFVLLLGLSVCVAILSGISHLYYRVFHQHVFRKSQVAYTILYIVCLLLLWNLLSDGIEKLNFFGTVRKKSTVMDTAEYNEMMASALASILLIYMVVYGFITDYRKNRKLQTALVQQRTQAELDALKAQVNPHFLFNSLNNIYGTAIQEDSPRTAESVQQLSGIVRYVMEESRLQTTDIRRELQFIGDFVELQRLRLPSQSNIDIQTTIDWDEQPARIVPLLLNPLIENAFKYGVSIQYPCFVHVSLQVQDGQLRLTTENSVLPRTDLEKGTGLGLANVRQRLDLAYPDRYMLTIDETDKTFRVVLTIDL